MKRPKPDRDELKKNISEVAEALPLRNDTHISLAVKENDLDFSSTIIEDNNNKDKKIFRIRYRKEVRKTINFDEHLAWQIIELGEKNGLDFSSSVRFICQKYFSKNIKQSNNQ